MASGRTNWMLFAISVASVASLIPLLWLMQNHVSDPDPSDLNHWWLVFGFSAQALFAGRLIVQWIATEKRRRSVVPASFWWLSLLGGLMLLVYFWRRSDPVGIAGQLFGNVVYLRNLYFLHAERRRARVVGGSARVLSGEGSGFDSARATAHDIDPVHPAIQVEELVAQARPPQAAGATEHISEPRSPRRRLAAKPEDPGRSPLVSRASFSARSAPSARRVQSRQRQ